MSFDLQKILESKRAFRRDLAAPTSGFSPHRFTCGNSTSLTSTSTCPGGAAPEKARRFDKMAGLMKEHWEIDGNLLSQNLMCRLLACSRFFS